MRRLRRRGGRDINKDVAKPPLKGADGVVALAKMVQGRHSETFVVSDHSVCAANFATFS